MKTREGVTLTAGWFGMVAGGALAAIATVAPVGEAQAAVKHSGEAMEQRLQELEAEVDRLRSELDHVRAQQPEDPAPIVHQQVQEELQKAGVGKKKHMAFFRGGFTAYNEPRGQDGGLGVGELLIDTNADGDGWYVGGGLDFSLTDDTWGFLPGTEILAEILLEWARFGQSVNNLTAIVATDPDIGDTTTTAVVSQLTIGVSPKIKFLNGHKFRPWIIPGGLAFHVVSPPSSGVTVFNPGVQFAVGADYNLWENVYLGVDARYHLTGDELDFRSNNGLLETEIDRYSAGAYLGFGF